MSAVKLFLAWIADVYAKNGYIAVLIVLAVFVALFSAIVLILGISPNDLWKALGG